jgi:hypothetical protein
MWTRGLPSGGFRGQAVTASHIADRRWMPDTPAPSQPFLRPFPQLRSAIPGARPDFKLLAHPFDVEDDRSDALGPSEKN